MWENVNNLYKANYDERQWAAISLIFIMIYDDAQVSQCFFLCRTQKWTRRVLKHWRQYQTRIFLLTLTFSLFPKWIIPSHQIFIITSRSFFRARSDSHKAQDDEWQSHYYSSFFLCAKNHSWNWLLLWLRYLLLKKYFITVRFSSFIDFRRWSHFN